MKPTEYVLGLLFRDNCTSVVLIRKTKPEWQANLLNGVGGKIEDGESPEQSMAREFMEETGAIVTNWRMFCEMVGNGFKVYCFTARDSAAWDLCRTMESEVIEKHHPDELNKQGCVSNLLWLVEMALDENYGKPPFATVKY